MAFNSNKTKNKSQQTSSGTSTTTVDPWSKAQFENQTQGLLGATTAYTSKPFESYTKPMVAGLSTSQQQARGLAQASTGSWGGILGDAEQSARDGASATWTPDSVDGPDKVSYRTFDKTRVQDRMNPYEDQVVDAAGAYYDEQLGKRMSENQARATQSGAYGGSRHGIADAELQRTSNMDRSNMMADLRYRGWNDAVAGDERETAGVYGADTYNSQAGYQARLTDAQRRDSASQFNAQQKLNAAGILGTLAGQRQQLSQNDVSMMERLGATEREIEQAKLLSDRSEFDRKAKDELDKLMLELQIRQGILGSTPMGQTTTSSGSGTMTGTTTETGFKFAPSFSVGGSKLSFGG